MDGFCVHAAGDEDSNRVLVEDNEMENWWFIFLSASSSEIVEVSLQIMVAVVCDKINAKEEELKATLANHLCCASLGELFKFVYRLIKK
ncbi:hypothetical protein EVAR_17174_1 [Eumeta japonica]|uniref:Uncharacterized protein n=1 Tax=Eumeta variegata TaxID=151549 RepID=A0A4C1U9P5_EUMVA|nr:hypothetical protein EVAR_17174_1 [Eumeta japonica]